LAIGDVAAARTAATAISPIIDGVPDFTTGFIGGLVAAGFDFLLFGSFFAGIDFAAGRTVVGFRFAQPPTCLPGLAAFPPMLFFVLAALTAGPSFLSALLGAALDLLFVRPTELVRLAI
jgi:hypothetical protein